MLEHRQGVGTGRGLFGGQSVRRDDTGEHLPHLRVVVDDEAGGQRALGGGEVTVAKVSRAIGYALCAIR